MEDRESVAIAVLEQALAEKRTHIRAMQADAEELERAIRQLRGGARAGASMPSTSHATVVDAVTAATLMEMQEKAVEDDAKFPAASFKGRSREEIAIVLAAAFDGYITTGAFRKVLAKPGVLKGVSQVASVASRVLMNSDRFERIFGGFYRLKGYSEDQQKTPP